MKVFINPGSGPVADTCEQHAIDNMDHFVTDCKKYFPDLDLKFVRIPSEDYGEGLFAFLLWNCGYSRCHEIQMPGLPLSKVRFMGEDDQNIWDFPRLYVDGSSWVWKFAITKDEIDWKEPQEEES